MQAERTASGIPGDGLLSPPEKGGVRKLAALRLSGGDGERIMPAIAEECPVALSYNGIAHVVMMATPADLEDFAVGFSLAEGIVGNAGEISDIDLRAASAGMLADVRIPRRRQEALLNRRRNLVGQSGCGICGVEELEEAIRPLAPIRAVPKISYPAAHRALETLRAHQPLNAASGAVHAASFIDDRGDILAAREDIGRHTALDKLTGHMARTGIDPESGCILLSSRCSYELVHKTIAARVPALMTISAPTTLAIELAREAGLTLIALARSDSILCFNDPHGLFAGPGGPTAREDR